MMEDNVVATDNADVLYDRKLIEMFASTGTKTVGVWKQYLSEYVSSTSRMIGLLDCYLFLLPSDAIFNMDVWPQDKPYDEICAIIKYSIDYMLNYQTYIIPSLPFNLLHVQRAATQIGRHLFIGNSVPYELQHYKTIVFVNTCEYPLTDVIRKEVTIAVRMPTLPSARFTGDVKIAIVYQLYRFNLPELREKTYVVSDTGSILHWKRAMPLPFAFVLVGDMAASFTLWEAQLVKIAGIPIRIAVVEAFGVLMRVLSVDYTMNSRKLTGCLREMLARFKELLTIVYKQPLLIQK
jgi:hypothetical protein